MFRDKQLLVLFWDLFFVFVVGVAGVAGVK